MFKCTLRDAAYCGVRSFLCLLFYSTLMRLWFSGLADPFEPLNSSLAQSVEELGRW